MVTKQDFYQNISELTAIAIAAGNAVMEIYESDDFGIESKEDDSPLTRADRVSNQIICDRLSELFPNTPIISEENKAIPYEERKDFEYCWMIDPIDGTKEFINKNGQFTVNIALIHNHETIGGVVYAPALKELYYAFQNHGAFMVKEDVQAPLKANQFNKSEEGLRIVCSKSHLNEATEAFIKDFDNPEKVPMGSSLKFVIIAMGKADVYPRLAPTMEWDTAAAQIILEEAGGRVIRADNGEKVTYNKEDLLNPHFIAYGIDIDA